MSNGISTDFAANYQIKVSTRLDESHIETATAAQPAITSRSGKPDNTTPLHYFDGIERCQSSNGTDITVGMEDPSGKTHCERDRTAEISGYELCSNRTAFLAHCPAVANCTGTW
jgi:hypothetical protein